MQGEFILTPDVSVQSGDDFYPVFLKSLREIGREIKSDTIRKAIKITAETMHISPEAASRYLVELGIRAPRSAFPRDFVRHIETRKDRSVMEQDSLTSAQRDLVSLW